MALHGDFSSYPLPELMQWLDGSRKTGALHMSWEAGTRKVFLLAGQVMATASPGLWERIARVLDVSQRMKGEVVMAQLKTSQQDAAPIPEVRALAEEELIGALTDLTQAQQGRFHWTEDPDRGDDEWVGLELSLRHALFESLRRMDELPDVERVLPHDALVVRGKPGAKPGKVLQQVVAKLASVEEGVTLGRLRLQLGLSRGVVQRAVYEMLRLGSVEVDGAQRLEEDPAATMLEKGAILLRERQFDAASLIFASLMQSDPADRRVRDFARMVEREHSASLYQDLPPLQTFTVNRDPTLMSALKSEERQVVAQVESGWDVSAVVLGSSLREVDALKLLQKLVRIGIARLKPAPPRT
jgi:hypothetical protein